jgi:hypothetical protein
VRRWADDYQSLAERLECGPRFVESFRTFLQTLRDKLLTPWDRALRAKHFFLFRRNAVRVPLSRAERSAIRNDNLKAALEHLSAAVHEGFVARRQRAADFQAALARWRAWSSGRSWLGALARLEADAVRQRHDLEASYEAWDRDWSGAVERLGDWLAEVNTLLGPYEPLLSADPLTEEVSARLTRVQREALDQNGAEEAVAWLQENWPAPGEQVEAVFALWELGLTVP